MRTILFCAFLHFVLSNTTDRRNLDTVAGYRRVSPGCIQGANIDGGIKSDFSLKECTDLCDNTPECLAVEFYYDHGVSGDTYYKAGDCKLNNKGEPSSTSYCSDYNLDLYIKKADCERDDAATKATCTASCGEVEAVVKTEADGGDSCFEYLCQPGDGQCKATEPTNCRIDQVESAKKCEADCQLVTAVEGTPAANGGAACPDKYECKVGDGSCQDEYVRMMTYSYKTCEAAGMESVLTYSECKTAVKKVDGSTVLPVTMNEDSRAYGCHFWVEDFSDPNSRQEVAVNTYSGGVNQNCRDQICYCRVKERTPTMRPTMPPSPAIKKMTFDMTISINETEVAEFKDELREAIATKFDTTMSKVFITVKSAARRKLETGESSNLEVEITNIDPDDVQGHTEMMKQDSFEADLAALIEDKIGKAVTISDVSDPVVAAMVTDSSPGADDYTDGGSSGGAGEAGAIGGIFGALCCCGCVGGIYYLMSKQRDMIMQAAEKAIETAGIDGNESGV